MTGPWPDPIDSAELSIDSRAFRHDTEKRTTGKTPALRDAGRESSEALAQHAVGCQTSVTPCDSSHLAPRMSVLEGRGFIPYRFQPLKPYGSRLFQPPASSLQNLIESPTVGNGRNFLKIQE